MNVACARCRHAMVLVPLGHAQAWGCTHCAAVMLTHEHATLVRAGVDRAAPLLAERAARDHAWGVGVNDPTPLRCPCCGEPMRVEWLRDRPVRLDQCPTHGVFFDAHELIALSPQPDLRPRYTGVTTPSAGDAALELLGTLFLGS